MNACSGGEIGMGTPAPPTPPGIVRGPKCNGACPCIGGRAPADDGPAVSAGDRFGGDADRGEIGDWERDEVERWGATCARC